MAGNRGSHRVLRERSIWALGLIISFPKKIAEGMTELSVSSKRSSKKSKSKSQPAAPAGAASRVLAPASSPASRGSGMPWLPWLGFALVLLAIVAWVVVHAFLVDTVTVRLCEALDKDIPVEKRMPVFLSEIAFDGYTWNRHAENLGKDGDLRLRFTDMDNAPDGREVHWNSGFAWYLRGLGEVYRAFTGDTLRNSIFRMSIWANPILLVVAIGIFSTLSARRFGPLCGTVIAIGMVAVPTFYEGFLPAYPDHHGLIAFALLGMLFGIAWAGAGWVQVESGDDFVPPHSLKQARHGIIFSAICGAAGLWISALSTAIVLGAIGMAAVVSALASRWLVRKDGCQFHPELWKLWALWGAGGSFVFYLIEYFPNHMSMRLEVNHPLYALAWIGGGWIIAEVSGWLNRSVTKPVAFPWAKLILPLACCAVLPLAMLIGGSAVYIPNDPFLGRLWKNIAELLPLITRINMGGLTWQVAVGWYPALIVASFVIMFFRSVGPGTKTTLVCLIVPILIITGLQLYQVRWGMLAGPLYIGLAGIIIPQVWRLVPASPVARSLGAVVLLGFGFLFVQPSFRNAFVGAWSQYRSPENLQLTPGQGLALLHRQMARTLLDDANGKPIVLLSSPNSSCLLSSIGGFQTVGTLYWENVDGLKKAAEALNAQTDEEGLALIQKLGVTHVSVMSWENFIEPFFGILYPERRPDKTFANSVGKKMLIDRSIPSWSRPLVFPPNELSKGLQQQILLLRVAPDQSPQEAEFHLAKFIQHAEGNPVRAEITYRQLLDQFPANVVVRAELVGLCLSQRRYDEAADQTLTMLKYLNPTDREAFLSNVISTLNAAGKQEIADRILKESSAIVPSP